jgi:type IV secretion system protein VirB1
MFAAIGLMACPHLAVPAEVMSHVVDVESGANPYAIGVVGGQLERQPRDLAEALATVHMLDAKGYNYSLGVAQVNRANLGKYGLDSYEKAFDACSNLAAGAQILAACYARSSDNWGKAFSCYYSGDFVTGYRDGYVQKVYDSINRGRSVDVRTSDSRAIPLRSIPTATVATVAGTDKAQAAPSPDNPGYRVAIRSVSFYSTTSSAVPARNTSSHGTTAPTATAQALPKSAAMPSVSTIAPAPASVAVNRTSSRTAADSSIFVPQVTGPNDPLPSPALVTPTASSQIASQSGGATNTQTARTREPGDAAFVF